LNEEDAGVLREARLPQWKDQVHGPTLVAIEAGPEPQLRAGIGVKVGDTIHSHYCASPWPVDDEVRVEDVVHRDVVLNRDCWFGWSRFVS
jgi:hypothetical protein